MESIYTKEKNNHHTSVHDRNGERKMDRKIKAVLSVMAGALAAVLLVWLFYVNDSVQMTLISRIRGVCLLTKIPASFEVEYYSPGKNKIRVYDENDKEVKTDYSVQGDVIRLNFTEKLKKGGIYHCTLKKGDKFIGKSVKKDLKDMRTLYFTRMSIKDRYFAERRNETWIAGDNLPDTYNLQNSIICLDDARLFLQNELVSWKEKIQLDKYDYEIYLDDERIGVTEGEVQCRGITEGKHVLGIEISGEGERLWYEKDIVITKQDK